MAQGRSENAAQHGKEENCDSRARIHSQTSTPFCFAFHTPHCELIGQYRLASQMRVTSLTRPGIVRDCRPVVGGVSRGAWVERSSTRGGLLPGVQGSGERDMVGVRAAESNWELAGRRLRDVVRREGNGLAADA